MTGPCATCGAVALPVVIQPGTDGDTAFPMAATRNVADFRITRPIADRVFCSFECARARGWPWLASETPKRQRAAA